MAKQFNILGVAKVELGEPGDGVMGANLTEFKDVEVGSPNIEGSSSNEETISTETNDNYLTVDGVADPTTFNIRLYGVSAEERVLLMGGKVGTVEDGEDEGNYMAPASKPSIYLSFKLTGKKVNGKQGIIKFPYGKINAREQGNITKNGLPAVDITITANTPEAADGTLGHPYIIGFEDVA